MGEIRTLISGDVTIRKIVGIVTVDEVLNSLREYYAGKVTKYVVWDLSEGSLKQLTSDDLNTIAEFVLKHAHGRTGGKTAIIAPTDLEYGIGRMLDTFSQVKDIPFNTQAFRTLSDAVKWLGVDVLPIINDMSGQPATPDRR